jgi:dihydroxyacid dehydratase/phosphogluconate dehydratase
VALVVLPNSERIATQYLLDVSEVAAIVGQRVWTVAPTNPTYPFVRLFRIGGIPALQRRLDEANLQLEAWGNTQSEARNLAAVTQAAMWELQSTVTDFGVVADVRDTLGLQYLPDPVTTKHRYVWSQALRVRPL